MNKKTCIILSEKKWNNNLVNKLKKKSDNIEWIKNDLKLGAEMTNLTSKYDKFQSQYIINTHHFISLT